ncbi:kinesin-like protein KIF25 isoform X2 [Anneissia japonica]|uniref:kinesin-like protein KIF25 isoform X2 n=1 Tax=Anneissia japonica TaxID=1529436 RepID=UPI001425794A|nr:kinesin-like protein KIF25 isoform X2 [Anneissia japonica]
MPLKMDLSHFVPEKIKECDRKLREKDEQLTLLKTENAMLHLKLAQLQGLVQASYREANLAKELLEIDKHSCKINSELALHLKNQIKDVKNDLLTLRSSVKGLPEVVHSDFQWAVQRSAELNQQMVSDNLDLQELRDKLFETEEELDEMKERHAKEKRRRRELHNTLVELRGNIRVHCRTRPLLNFDSGKLDPSNLGQAGTPSEEVIMVIDDENLSVKANKAWQQTTPKNFEFERVYSPVEDQKVVFEEVQPLLTSLLDGYNVCIMAYGQTGSGKTYTMLGDSYTDPTTCNDNLQSSPSEGVIPRAARELFRLVNERTHDFHRVEMSVAEIYNNEIRDLLHGNSGRSLKHTVTMADDGSCEVPSLTQRMVQNASEVVDLVHYGMLHRHEDATLVHAHSSRSHLIVTLTITSISTSSGSTSSSSKSSRCHSPLPRSTAGTMTPPPYRRRIPSLKIRSRSPSPSRSTPPPDMTGIVKTKLQLVDLAGSECVGMSGVTGAALRETSFINRSLSALADVLAALAEERSHIPYRNSKLTHMLQDTIGGDAKLLVMCCVSPAQRYITESLQCLGFGSRARQIQRGPPKKRTSTSFVAGINSSCDSSPTTTPRGRSRFSSFPVVDKTEHKLPPPKIIVSSIAQANQEIVLPIPVKASKPSNIPIPKRVTKSDDYPPIPSGRRSPRPLKNKNAKK